MPPFDLNLFTSVTAEHKLYVKGFAPDTTEATVRDIFRKFGAVDAVEFLKDRYTGQPSGSVLVKLGTRDEAVAALRGLDGATWHGVSQFWSNFPTAGVLCLPLLQYHLYIRFSTQGKRKSKPRGESFPNGNSGGNPERAQRQTVSHSVTVTAMSCMMHYLYHFALRCVFWPITRDTPCLLHRFRDHTIHTLRIRVLATEIPICLNLPIPQPALVLGTRFTPRQCRVIWRHRRPQPTCRMTATLGVAFLSAICQTITRMRTWE